MIYANIILIYVVCANKKFTKINSTNTKNYFALIGKFVANYVDNHVFSVNILNI